MAISETTGGRFTSWEVHQLLHQVRQEGHHQEHLQGEDVFHMAGNIPAVDLAIMALCDITVIDYGTFSLWGAVLSGGEVIISRNTFRDARWAADYLGWTYL